MANTCGQKLLTEMHSKEKGCGEREKGAGHDKSYYILAFPLLFRLAFVLSSSTASSAASAAAAEALAAANFCCILINMQSKNVSHTDKATITAEASGRRDS